MDWRSIRSDRVWGGGLILIGNLLLGTVFVLALGILGDPGARYEEWRGGEDPIGPEASFDWSANGRTVQFADSSREGDGALNSWVWDFGDGMNSEEPQTEHRFSEDGNFTVTLRVADVNGNVSTAEGEIEVGPEAATSGEGTIGLADLADQVIATVERATRSGLVVLLVIGMFVILTMVGGRVLRQGVNVLRPVPNRVSVKLRPKELQLMLDDRSTDVHVEPVPTREERQTVDIPV